MKKWLITFEDGVMAIRQWRRRRMECKRAGRDGRDGGE